MKRPWQDPKYIEAALIFFVIQPALFFGAIAVFVCAVVKSIWA
jgi:hypothetical protein